MDRHRFNDEPDQDPTFYFNADRDPDPESVKSVTHVGEQDFLKLLFTKVPVHILFFSSSS